MKSRFGIGLLGIAACALGCARTDGPSKAPPGARPEFVQERAHRREGPPEGIVTKVVPTVVVEKEVRYERAPGVDELLPKLQYTETPRINRKRPVEIGPDGYEPPAPLVLTPTGRLDDREVSRAVAGAFGVTWDSFDLGDSGAIPPDPHGAAGPGRVMNVVNSNFAIYDQGGVLRTSGTLFSFFDPISSTSTFDPRVIYDTIHDRFVVISLEFFTSGGTQSKILVAVSDDSDPLGTWFLQEINALTNIGGQLRFADYPSLAVDEDAVYVTANMFGVSSGSFANAQIFILKKGVGAGGFYDGGTGTVTKILPPGGGNNFTLAATQMIGPHPNPAVGTYFASYNGAFISGSNKFVQVFTLSDPIATPTLTQELVDIGNPEPTSAVPDAPQPAGVALDVDKRQIMDAVWRDNKLYMVTTMRVSNQATVHWLEMDTTTLGGTVLLDQGNIDGEEIATSAYTFYPSIAVDSVGRVGIGFAASGTTLFAGSYFTYRFPDDPPGTHQPSQTVRAGVAAYVTLDQFNRNRWGDYSGVDFDPVTDCFWVYGEYVKSASFWGTRWGQFCLDFECGNGDVEPGETCDPPGQPTGQPDACRSDCFFCGDGGLELSFEECDDGNNTGGDGCDPSCRYEYCGNGVVQAGEQCDPAGGPAGQPDECRFNCTYCGDGAVNAAGGNLIANGGFELGAFAGWTTRADGSGGFFIDAPGTTTPLSGKTARTKLGIGPTYAVSDANSSGTEALEQGFTVPASATSVTLVFDMFVNNCTRWACSSIPPGSTGTSCWRRTSTRGSIR